MQIHHFVLETVFCIFNGRTKSLKKKIHRHLATCTHHHRHTFHLLSVMCVLLFLFIEQEKLHMFHGRLIAALRRVVLFPVKKNKTSKLVVVCVEEEIND